MIVCHCMNITDAQIIEKVKGGVDTVEDLARVCGITMGCGGCYSSVEKIIKNAKLEVANLSGVNRPIDCVRTCR